mgnify:CR=1 FL=1
MKKLTRKEQNLKNELLLNLENLQQLILNNIAKFKIGMIKRKLVIDYEYFAVLTEKQKAIDISMSIDDIYIYSKNTFLKIFSGSDYQYKKRDMKRYLNILEYKAIEKLSNDLDFISLNNLFNEIIE